MNVLGVDVDFMTLEVFLEQIKKLTSLPRTALILNHNLHSVYLYHRLPEFQQIFKHADVIFVDGMPIVWLARWKGSPVNADYRLTCIDWIHPVMRMSVKMGWRVFFIGGTPHVANRAEETLKRRHKGLQLKTFHGYFDRAPNSKEQDELFRRLHAYRPDIILVGMGMPLQELWIKEYYHRFPPSVIITVGGLMDLVAGKLPVPPRWIGRMGLEWLYRLVTQPRRVWKRYIVEPVFLLPWIAKEFGDMFGRIYRKYI